MNLYRLDYHDGHKVSPVKDALGQTWLGRRHALAVAAATDRASCRGVPVVITRISGCGYLRPVLRIHPDGRRQRIR